MQAMFFPTHKFPQISLTICNLEPGRFQVEFLSDVITPFKELVVFVEVLTSQYAELNGESFDTLRIAGLSERNVLKSLRIVFSSLPR
jgi:hypothetical protein